MFIRVLSSGICRAVGAVLTAILLVVVLTTQQRSVAAAEQAAIFKVSALSWSVSEVLTEGLKLSRALADFRYGSNDLAEIRKNFDLLWSRYEIIQATKFEGLPGVDLALADIKSFLVEGDATLFEDDILALSEAYRLNFALTEVLGKLRQEWIAEFSGNRFGRLAVLNTDKSETQERNTILIQVLLGLIFAYMISEIYFSGRARAREQKLLAAAETANEEKSSFLANVSHEIRTPLNGILGMAQYLRETELTEDQKECLDVVQESGSVLLSTISDVLDISKVEAGGLDFEHVPFDPLETARASLKLYQFQAQEKGLKLALMECAPLPSLLIGDPHKIRQILHNLISNAIKFTDEGTIEVAIKPYRVALSGKQTIAFHVNDTGIGIAPDAVEKVFEPFRQADDSTSRIYGGTGLGLSISKKIAEAMGGSLTVESVLGVGTTFEFVCCFETQSEVETAIEVSKDLEVKVPEGALAACSLPPLAGRVSVLGVDDNRTNRLILERLLSNQNCALDIVTSGQEAIERCRETYYDVILMDVQMPGMSGIEAMQVIRDFQSARGQRSRIIAVTANGGLDQISQYLEDGMDSVVTKPVTKAKLVEQLGYANVAPPLAS